MVFARACHRLRCFPVTVFSLHPHQSHTYKHYTVQTTVNRQPQPRDRNRNTIPSTKVEYQSISSASASAKYNTKSTTTSRCYTCNITLPNPCKTCYGNWKPVHQSPTRDAVLRYAMAQPIRQTPVRDAMRCYGN